MNMKTIKILIILALLSVVGAPIYCTYIYYNSFIPDGGPVSIIKYTFDMYKRGVFN